MIEGNKGRESYHDALKTDCFVLYLVLHHHFNGSIELRADEKRQKQREYFCIPSLMSFIH